MSSKTFQHSTRPTLGIYAPLPGTRSGIADYALSSCALLTDLFTTTIVSLENYVAPRRFDHVLYHIGCGRDSAAAYRAAGERPGPIILHEHILSQFFIENHDLLDDATNERVRDAFGRALGREFTSSDLYKLMRTERDLGLHYLDLHLECLVIGRATTVLTHSRTSLATLRDRYGKRIHLLDFPTDRLPCSRRGAVRARLGIPDTAVVFGSFGFVGSHKRLPQLIRAWELLKPEPEVAHLLIVGQGANQLSHRSHTILTTRDHVESLEDFGELLGSVDVGIQLRWPTLGETSGIVSQLLANEIPVIISTKSILPTWANQDLVRTVPPGPHEEANLMAAMRDWLGDRPSGDGGFQCENAWRKTILANLGDHARSQT